MTLSRPDVKSKTRERLHAEITGHLRDVLEEQYQAIGLCLHCNFDVI